MKFVPLPAPASLDGQAFLFPQFDFLHDSVICARSAAANVNLKDLRISCRLDPSNIFLPIADAGRLARCHDLLTRIPADRISDENGATAALVLLLTTTRELIEKYLSSHPNKDSMLESALPAYAQILGEKITSIYAVKRDPEALEKAVTECALKSHEWSLIREGFAGTRQREIPQDIARILMCTGKASGLPDGLVGAGDADLLNREPPSIETSELIELDRKLVVLWQKAFGDFTNPPPAPDLLTGKTAQFANYLTSLADQIDHQAALALDSNRAEDLLATINLLRKLLVNEEAEALASFNKAVEQLAFNLERNLSAKKCHWTQSRILEKAMLASAQKVLIKCAGEIGSTQVVEKLYEIQSNAQRLCKLNLPVEFSLLASRSLLVDAVLLARLKGDTQIASQEACPLLGKARDYLLWEALERRTLHLEAFLSHAKSAETSPSHFKTSAALAVKAAAGSPLQAHETIGTLIKEIHEYLIVNSRTEAEKFEKDLKSPLPGQLEKQREGILAVIESRIANTRRRIHAMEMEDKKIPSSYMSSISEEQLTELQNDISTMAMWKGVNRDFIESLLTAFVFTGQTERASAYISSHKELPPELSKTLREHLEHTKIVHAGNCLSEACALIKANPFSYLGIRKGQLEKVELTAAVVAILECADLEVIYNFGSSDAQIRAIRKCLGPGGFRVERARYPDGIERLLR